MLMFRDAVILLKKSNKFKHFSKPPFHFYTNTSVHYDNYEQNLFLSNSQGVIIT